MKNAEGNQKLCENTGSTQKTYGKTTGENIRNTQKNKWKAEEKSETRSNVGNTEAVEALVKNMEKLIEFQKQYKNIRRIQESIENHN